MRTGKELILATKPFAHEQRARSWFHLISTTAVLSLFWILAAAPLPLFIRLPGSILAGLTFVRMFILFHDQQHGAIFRGSWFANVCFWLFGIFTLNPSSVWRRSHDHHHQHNSKELNPNIGSFPLMTVQGYATAPFWPKLGYRLVRSNFTLLFGYITVFLGSMCVLPLFRNPRKHFDAVISIVCHFGVAAALVAYGSWLDALLIWFLPFLIGSGLGAYLFFAQHNFPGVRLQLDGKKWDYVDSALYSSSFYKMGPLMNWFTGSIGYHHVHHLNAKIPFYRLPEAMAAIPELQSPTTVTFAPRDVWNCLRLKLWDSEGERLVSWREGQRLLAKKKGASPVLAPVIRPTVAAIPAPVAEAAG